MTVAQRVPQLPDVPTVAELGWPGFDGAGWAGLVAPRGTPQAVVDKLNAEVVKILNMADVKERFAAGGVDTIPSTPAELDARVKKTAAQLAVIVEKAKIKPD